jgi:hypothetical protein
MFISPVKTEIQFVEPSSATPSSSSSILVSGLIILEINLFLRKEQIFTSVH